MRYFITINCIDKLCSGKFIKSWTGNEPIIYPFLIQIKMEIYLFIRVYKYMFFSFFIFSRSTIMISILRKQCIFYCVYNLYVCTEIERWYEIEESKRTSLSSIENIVIFISPFFNYCHSSNSINSILHSWWAENLFTNNLK